MRIKSLITPSILAVYRRTALRLLGAAAAVTFLWAGAQTAYAHSLTVTASAACGANGGALITYTVTSWHSGAAADLAGTYPFVEIDFNGIQVDNEAFTLANENIITATLPAPGLTNSVTVTATTDQNPPGSGTYTWGDGGNFFSTSSVDVTIPTDCATGNGRFTGGGKLVLSSGLVVTKGFEVDCDRDPAHENLELNWTGGNHFHMDMITGAACTLIANPAPPFAPVNKIVATGTGSYDNMDGYTVLFTLIDNGEPGVNDQAGFVVCLTDPADPNTCANPANVVLNVPVQTVTTGNIQAHVDQH